MPGTGIGRTMIVVQPGMGQNKHETVHRDSSMTLLSFQNYMGGTVK